MTLYLVLCLWNTVFSVITFILKYVDKYFL